MSNQPNCTTKSLYEYQETQLSRAFLDLLTQKGLLEDKQIDDPLRRKAKQTQKRNMYHNTVALLRLYRDIRWVLECLPGTIASELQIPLNDLDKLLDAIRSEYDTNNYKLESRIQSASKSRLLMQRLNEALTILQKKPGNGSFLYRVIYETYLSPEKIPIEEVVDRLHISMRHYYRVRTQAINVISISLWSAPAGELDSWLEVLTLLEITLKENCH